MKPIFSIREMLLMVVIAVLAVGWLMDRYRQESIIKMQQGLETRQTAQMDSVLQGYKMQQEEINELFKLLPEEQIRAVTWPIQDKFRKERATH